MKKRPLYIKVSRCYNWASTPHPISLTAWRNSVFLDTLLKRRNGLFVVFCDTWKCTNRVWSSSASEVLLFQWFFPWHQIECQKNMSQCLRNSSSFVPWEESSWTYTTSVTCWTKNAFSKYISVESPIINIWEQGEFF